MILCEELGFTMPCVIEKENKLLLSVKNWKEVGRSLLLTTLRSLLVDCWADTSPN